jgi:DNA adenine methylase
VLLSGYPSPLYDELYADWWRVEHHTFRPTTSRLGNRAPATEVIWSNRPLASQLRLDQIEADLEDGVEEVAGAS